MDERHVVLLSGGYGGARLAPALVDVLRPARLTIVANVGDDLTWLGMRVCPDVDSLLYALAGVWDADRGWGRRDETFRLRDELVRLGAPGWFGVGDLDLALHLLRAERLARGDTLVRATDHLARHLGVASGVRVVPASNEPNETRVELADGRVLHFQEWYVRERAGPTLKRVLLARGRPSPEALEALATADAVILGPSNPVSSIGSILALLGVRQAVGRVPTRMAVSPVVVGVPVREEGVRHHAVARERLLATASIADRPAAIASLYADLVESFVLDEADAGEARDVESIGLRPLVSRLLDPSVLARDLVSGVAPRSPANGQRAARAVARPRPAH